MVLNAATLVTILASHVMYSGGKSDLIPCNKEGERKSREALHTVMDLLHNGPLKTFGTSRIDLALKDKIRDDLIKAVGDAVRNKIREEMNLNSSQQIFTN